MAPLRAEGMALMPDANHLEVRLTKGPAWMVGEYKYDVVQLTPAELTLRLGSDITKMKRAPAAGGGSQ